MSGGTIPTRWAIEDILSEIELELSLTEVIYKPKLLKYFEDIQSDLNEMHKVIKSLDYLFSGDTGEEDFIISYNIYRSKRGEINYKNEDK